MRLVCSSLAATADKGEDCKNPPAAAASDTQGAAVEPLLKRGREGDARPETRASSGADDEEHCVSSSLWQSAYSLVAAHAMSHPHPTVRSAGMDGLRLVSVGSTLTKLRHCLILALCLYLHHRLFSSSPSEPDIAISRM